MTTSKLNSFFTRSDAAYKTVNGHDIKVSVWIPKTVKRGLLLPVAVRWHGGALMNGARNHEDWWPTWTIELANLHSAIIVTPDYRLLPEATGADLLSDLHSFYAWLEHSLPSHISALQPTSDITADLSSVFILGQSAGGYMAIQSALLLRGPAYAGSISTLGVKAVMAHYPMLDLRESWYSEPGKKELWHTPSPVVEPDYIDKLLASIAPGTVVSSRIPEEGAIDLFAVLLEAGRFTEVLGREDGLFPLENLEVVKRDGVELPPVWIFHGSGDTVIPARGSVAFKDRAERLGLLTGWDLRVTFEEGDHGFDAEATLETGWVKEGLGWLGKYWP